MIAVLVADDHHLMRRGIEMIFQDTPDIRIVAEAADGETALRQARRVAWDVLLLDLGLPGMKGVDVLLAVKNIRADAKVLILTMHAQDERAVRLFEAGAMGYITKDADPKLIIEAVRRVASGRRYLSAELAELLLDARAGQTSLNNLSAREYQVLLRLVDGQSTSAIAAVLKVTPQTISTIKRRLMDKLKLKTEADLIKQFAYLGG